MAIVLLVLIAAANVIQFHHHDCTGSAHVCFTLAATSFDDDTSDNKNNNCCHDHSHQCDDSTCSLRISLSSDILESPAFKRVCLNYDSDFSYFDYPFAEGCLVLLYKTELNYEIQFEQSFPICPNCYRGSPIFA